jgi:tight adherence protein B
VRAGRVVTAAAWLALAGAIGLAAAPGPVPTRVGALTGAGRLVGRDGLGRSGLRWSGPSTVSWRRLAVLSVAAASIGVTAARGPLLGVAAAAAGAAVWVVVRDAVAARAVAARRAQLLAALRVLIGELEAGARPPSSLAAAGEAGRAYAAVFTAAASAAAAGQDAGAALLDEPDTRVVGLAWQLGEDTGTALAVVLSRVADDLAAADDQRRAVAVALAGPRASAAVLSGLPVVGLGLGAAMGARPWQFLLGPTSGRAVCCAGVLLDVAGVLWMRRILRRAGRE